MINHHQGLSKGPGRLALLRPWAGVSVGAHRHYAAPAGCWVLRQVERSKVYLQMGARMARHSFMDTYAGVQGTGKDAAIAAGR